MTTSDSHEAAAMAYLIRQLGQDAPERIEQVAHFDESPLEGEGPVSLYRFEAGLGGNPLAGFYVASGQTEPNYYPAHDLDPDEIFSVHIGTRFMLVLEISQLPLDQLPADWQQAIAEQFSRIAPGEPIRSLRPVAAFRLEQQRHVISRLAIAAEDVYVVSGDLPLGIYRKTHLPPHLVYRLHLGNVIRREEAPRPD